MIVTCNEFPCDKPSDCKISDNEKRERKRERERALSVWIVLVALAATERKQLTKRSVMIRKENERKS
jgi:hypothetical protein